MRAALLLALLTVARADVDPADVDPAAIVTCEWGLGLFLQFDTYGDGAWCDAKAGAMARFDCVSTMYLPSFDPRPGATRMVPTSSVSQMETRVEKRDESQLVLARRWRPANDKGKPGTWEKPTSTILRLVQHRDWKTESQGKVSHRAGSQTLVGRSFRVQFPGNPAGTAGDVWHVVVSKGLGVLSARQEAGDRAEWNLVDPDVEIKAASRKWRCREYEYRWTQPPDIPWLGSTTRRLFLCVDAPGRVVKRTYAGVMTTQRVEETLVSCRGG